VITDKIVKTLHDLPEFQRFVRRVSLPIVEGKSRKPDSILNTESSAKNLQALRLARIEARRIDTNPGMTQVADVERST